MVAIVRKIYCFLVTFTLPKDYPTSSLFVTTCRYAIVEGGVPAEIAGQDMHLLCDLIAVSMDWIV